MHKATPGPWFAKREGFSTVYVEARIGGGLVQEVAACGPTVAGQEQQEANARLIAAAPTQHAEMLRYLPVLERAESDPKLWAQLTEGLGIATLNSYRHAIAKATGGGV